MLALYDDVQDQMTQEIDRVYKEAGEAGRTELSYTEDLPKFRYLLAFMVSRQPLLTQLHHVISVVFHSLPTIFAKNQPPLTSAPTARLSV